MRNHAKWILLLSVSALPLAAEAAAEVAKKSPVVQDPADETAYAGLGFARVSSGVDGVSAATNLTGVIGIHPKGVDWAALELELGTTVASGDVSPPAADRHFSMQHAAVFGVLRSPGVVYGVGRFGYQYMNTGLDALNGRHSGAAWSAGGGWRIHQASAVGAELLYTHVSNDVHYWGLRLNYGFGASKEPKDRYLDH